VRKKRERKRRLKIKRLKAQGKWRGKRKAAMSDGKPNKQQS